jgi:hypothetical protein
MTCSIVWECHTLSAKLHDLLKAANVLTADRGRCNGDEGCYIGNKLGTIGRELKLSCDADAAKRLTFQNNPPASSRSSQARHTAPMLPSVE